MGKRVTAQSVRACFTRAVAHFPAVCDACKQVSLIGSTEVAPVDLPCPDCGGPALVLTGAAYSSEDVPAFAALQRIVSDTSIAASEAKRLAAEVSRAYLAGSEKRLVTKIAARFPALISLRFLTAEREQQRRTMLILGNILQAKARGRHADAGALLEDLLRVKPRGGEPRLADKKRARD